MADNKPKQTIDPAAGTSPTPEPLGPEEFLKQLRAVMERAPVPEAPPAHRAFRRRLAHVDPKFIDLTINAVGASPAAQAAISRTDEDMRAEVDTVVRWAAVADEMLASGRKIAAANDIRRQRLGLTSMQVYRICEQLARDEADEKLTAFVREMKRMNKFGRRRRHSPKPPEVLAKKE